MEMRSIEARIRSEIGRAVAMVVDGHASPQPDTEPEPPFLERLSSPKKTLTTEG